MWPAHLLLCSIINVHATGLQVKGQKRDQKVKAKVDKQEVEIRQRMTVAALAEAMNKDFGKKDQPRERIKFI